MASLQQIQELGERIGRDFGPEKVLLFGSYARGDQRPDSDVDLLVIMQTKDKPVYQAARIRAALRTDYPLDVIVRTPERTRELLEQHDAFITEIMDKGKVLYENRADVWIAKAQGDDS